MEPTPAWGAGMTWTRLADRLGWAMAWVLVLVFVLLTWPWMLLETWRDARRARHVEDRRH